jgi:DNA primase
MHLAGVGTAVATCGTALGDGHFDLLRRFTEKVVLAFDSDAAGSKAALRSDELESPFRLDLDLRVAVMPDGLDPADLVQKERADELAKSVATAKPLLEHRIEHEVAKHDLTGPEGRARALHAAVAQVRRVNDDIARREYARYVARLIGVDIATVEKAIAGGGRVTRPDGKGGDTPLDRSEAELFRVIISDPVGRDEVIAEDFTDARLRVAFLALAPQFADGSPIDVSSIEDPEARALVLGLMMDQRPLPDWPDVARLLGLRRLEDRIDVLEGQMKEMSQGTQAHSDALRELIALQQERQSLGY